MKPKTTFRFGVPGIILVVAVVSIDGLASSAIAQEPVQAATQAPTRAPTGARAAQAQAKAACPPDLARTARDAASVQPCLTALKAVLGIEDKNHVTEPSFRALPRSASPRQRTLAQNEDLLDEYLRYVAAKAALSAVNALAASPEAQDVAALGVRLHELLPEQNLEETAPVYGELRTGSAVSDAGGFNNAPTGGKSTPGVLAHLTWETPHAGAIDKASGHDFSLAGTFGLQPAMTLVQTTADGGSELDAKYVQALVIDTGVQLGWFSGSHEQSLLARAGFVRLGETSQIIERGGESVLAIPAGASDKVAPYGEFGYRFNMHDAPMSLVHLAKTPLNPRLSAEAAFRVDSRFRATGSLADFSRPALRWVVRLMLDGVNIVDRLSGQEKTKTFVATFGFEYEGGFRSGIPAGFQVIIRGDIDLLKALKGNQADTP